MAYLIDSDFYRSIDPTLYNQFVTKSANIIPDATAQAIERAKGMLRQKYYVDQEFTNTALYNSTTVYGYNDRVYIVYNPYSSASSYSVGSYCVYNYNSYVCIEATTGSFNPAKWLKLGYSPTIYYAQSPYELFNVYGSYRVDDKIMYKGSVYKALQPSMGDLANSAAVQYITEDNLPLHNVFPDDPNQGIYYWQKLSLYTVPANKLNSVAAYTPSNTYNTGDYSQFEGSIYICIGTSVTGQFDTSKWQIVWRLGDNRSQLMLNAIVDMALYHASRTISPQNIPELRAEMYNQALIYLSNIRDGIETPNLQAIQPKKGNRILADYIVKRNNTY